MFLDLQQKISTQFGVYTEIYPPSGADEVNEEVVIQKLLSYMLMLMVP